MSDLRPDYSTQTDSSLPFIDCVSDDSDCTETVMVGQKDVDQTGPDKLAPDVAVKGERPDTVDELFGKLKVLQEQNDSLKAQLKTESLKRLDLEVQCERLDKDLDEMKRITDIQENCIENSESEILRLNECLKESERLFQETVDTSQEIINDLKSKLKTCTDSELKSPIGESSAGPAKGQASKRQNRTSFYVGLTATSVTNTSDNRIKGNSCDIKVLANQMADDMRLSVVQQIRKLVANSGLNWEAFPQILSKTLDKSFGKHWNCIVGQNVLDDSLNHYPDNYVKLILNSSLKMIVFKTSEKAAPCPPLASSSQPLQNNHSNTDESERGIRVVRKSPNIDPQTEKMIICVALEAINREDNDYQTMSCIIRDSICDKSNSQWFVSVGQTQHYTTSWAMAKSRKFLLFEIGQVKFTVGEVGGNWIWR